MAKYRKDRRPSGVEYEAAREAGARARRNGRAFADCPYRKAPSSDKHRQRLRQAWCAGWTEEERREKANA